MKEIRAKKNPRNQAPRFDESLAAPYMPAPSLPMTPHPADPAHNTAAPASRIPARALRYGLIAVWALAAITAGIGVGRLLRTSTVATEPGVPVAHATVAVASAASVAAAAGTIGAARPAPAPHLTVVAGTDVVQAQAGNVFATASGPAVQGALASGALQPGFTHFGHPQGNIGTTPVR